MILNHLTVYAKYGLLSKKPKKYRDVQIFKDKELNIPFVKFTWYDFDKPSKRNKYITLNCFKYKLEWVS